MCKQGDYEVIKLRIPADHSSSGKSYMKWVKVDRCIAGIVEALQGAGITMRASCCGHGNGDGKIFLQDGRELIIKKGE